MKARIESTPKIVTLVEANVPIQARIWEGVTESGIPFHLYVTRVAVDPKLNTTQFETELRECKPASPEIQAIPLRLIL